jgi:hypothetical protein
VHFVSEHLDRFINRLFWKVMHYVGYIITYPGIMARPVSGSPSSAFSPARYSEGIHIKIQNTRK